MLYEVITKFNGVAISAYASPDGPTDLNTKLSEQRQKTAESYLAKELKKAKVNQSAEGFFDLKNTPEDWEGFKALMEASSIQDKELILRVLSMYSDPEVREKDVITSYSIHYTKLYDIGWMHNICCTVMCITSGIFLRNTRIKRG